MSSFAQNEQCIEHIFRFILSSLMNCVCHLTDLQVVPVVSSEYSSHGRKYILGWASSDQRIQKLKTLGSEGELSALGLRWTFTQRQQVHGPVCDSSPKKADVTLSVNLAGVLRGIGCPQVPKTVRGVDPRGLRPGK